MNGFERLELAELLFDEGELEAARTHLELLRNDAEAMKYHERDIARRCPRRVHIIDGQVATDERDQGPAQANAAVTA